MKKNHDKFCFPTVEDHCASSKANVFRLSMEPARTRTQDVDICLIVHGARTSNCIVER